MMPNTFEASLKLCIKLRGGRKEKKKQAVPSTEHKVEGERGTETRPFKAFKAF